MTEYIKDRLGNVMGRIEEHGNVLYAKDRYGNTQARYDKVSNRTLDRLGNIVSQGNTLANFIH